MRRVRLQKRVQQLLCEPPFFLIAQHEALNQTPHRFVPSWNQFGLDFKAAGSKWTKRLCQMDSDGDGVSNGLELGDPCCLFDVDDPTTYNLIELLRPISHPGFPSSAIAAPGSLDLSARGCPAPAFPLAERRTNTSKEYDPTFFLEGEPQHVQTFFIKRLEVQTGPTVYEWVSWNWDDCYEKECYLVGMEVLVDNMEMSHHWTLAECTQPPRPSDASNGERAPAGGYRVGGCETMIGFWAPGLDAAYRATPEMSRRFPSNLRGFNINIHYNNPQRRSGQFDQSGFRVYYTTKPRKYLAGVLSPIRISAYPGIRLPPRKKRLHISSACTLSGLTEPIHVNNVIPAPPAFPARTTEAHVHQHKCTPRTHTTSACAR